MSADKCNLSNNGNASLIHAPLMTTTQGTLEKNVILLNDHERWIFFCIFFTILSIAVLGNVGAIIATIKRNNRFLQKSSIISLALSDLLMAISYSVNNLETFSHRLINWTLGPFLCSFIPTAQMIGLTASTSAMVVIAIDRYRNVVHPLTERWNPKPITCIFGLFCLWSSSIALASPLFNMFTLKSSTVYFLDETDTYLIQKERLHFCLSLVKEQLRNYYICMASIIFSSLLIIFLWLYYHIAKLVWKHRKPISNRHQQTSSETSTTQLRSTTEQFENKRLKSILAGGKNIHVERKIRTFKIIIFITLVFFICRVPFWVLNIIKLIWTFNGHGHWLLLYSFNCLALVNCAINPFLYTFLNPTISVLAKIQRTVIDFISKVCCCCCSNADFEEFERENPFGCKKVDAWVIPTKRNSKVQFRAVAVVEMYPKESTYEGSILNEVDKY